MPMPRRRRPSRSRNCFAFVFLVAEGRRRGDGKGKDWISEDVRDIRLHHRATRALATITIPPSFPTVIWTFFCASPDELFSPSRVRSRLAATIGRRVVECTFRSIGESRGMETFHMPQPLPFPFRRRNPSTPSCFRPRLLSPFFRSNGSPSPPFPPHEKEGNGPFSVIAP